ncbi:hypothetical protein HNQ77_002105 [Silvibacterium bohemicum]|uniref:Uncharacterized protein n=1 Tax=Silvibacterium bohemicum TaxID=1577686 RepID=A0A841JRW8_9BACT|nr:hypothetical protein [Silvibacterium bohemicum]MBB6144153.1 hypothetical protein [Silvibacterium bohemicum]
MLFSMNLAPQSPKAFPVSYYFMGLRLILLAALIGALLYIVGLPTHRTRRKQTGRRGDG